MHKTLILVLGLSAAIWFSLWALTVVRDPMLSIVIATVMYVGWAIELMVNCTCKDDKKQSTATGPT